MAGRRARMTVDRPGGGEVRLRRTLRTLLGGMAGLAFALALTGVAYEAIASAGDAERYPPPGRLLDVGDHRLHLYCVGEGSPTVVLEAGLGEQSMTWGYVQPGVATSTRVCSYDRAGYGWSEAGPEPRTYLRAAEELHALLRRAGEKEPYVLVGHSIGSYAVRLFAHLFPEEVAGMVLVDPTNEESAIRAGEPRLPELIYRFYGFLGRVGIVRLFGPYLVPAQAGGAPPSQVTENIPVVYGPKSMATAAAELEVSVRSAKLVAAVSAPAAWDDLPVAVISAADATEEDLAHHAALSRLTTRGGHVVAQKGGHYVHYDEPELVTGEIRWVVEAVRR
jgi:pimeloyl-ACP methyl ester carboxylesterase